MRIKHTHHLGRAAQDHRAVRKLFAFGHQRAGTHQAAFANFCAVQNHRTNANQAAVADGAAVQHHLMANRHLVAHCQGHAQIGMQHAEILDIAAPSHRDALGVAAQHGTKPDTAVRA